MSHLALTLDQAQQIFSQLALLQIPAYQNSKLSFGQTGIQLESNSSLWRTAASYIHGYLPSYTYGRDLTSLYPLVEAAGHRYYELARDARREVTWSLASLKAVGEIKAAREGLQALKTHQYAAQLNKAQLIQRSIEALELTETNIRKFILEYIGRELAQNQIGQDVVPASLLREKEGEIELLKTQVAFLKEANDRLWKQLEEKVALRDEKAGDDL